MATKVFPAYKEITLYGNVPSKKNSKRRVQRGHHVFMIPSQAHEDWHGLQIHVARNTWKGKEPLQKVEFMELIFTADSKRRSDLSNKAESVMDLLVDAGILLDDNWFVVPELILRLDGIDKKEPKVVIRIY